MDPGIDYGMGTTNVDRESHIRFGVIPMHTLHEWAWENLEEDYGDPTCPKCGGEAVEWNGGDEHDSYEEYRNYACDYACESCRLALTGDDVYSEHPLNWTLNDGTYEGIVHHDDGDLFVTKSPYYTFCSFCSPCAPGAGYLLNSCPEGPKVYCLGHEWFTDDKAPYPVYRVEDNSLLQPEDK